ncbi:MAG: hypothetical protein II721_04670 [Bacilli bacterium]|nr:hypothetical protein [Bacilli bacterium]
MNKKTLFKTCTLLSLPALLSACGQNASSGSSAPLPSQYSVTPASEESMVPASQESQVSSSEGSLAPTTPLTYGFYTIEEGVTDLSFIQGYPWINTSVEGVMGKIKKPAQKDDFYAHTNYEAMKDVAVPEGGMQAGGYFDTQVAKNVENLNALFTKKGTELEAIAKTLIEGGKDSIKAEVETLLSADEAAIRSIFASSSMFRGISKFFDVGHVTQHDEIGVCFYEGKRVMGLPYFVKLVGEFSLEQMKTDLATCAAAEGINENLETRIGAAMDSLFAILKAAKAADNKTTHVSTLGSLDNVFKGIFNPKKALQELGVENEREVTYTDYELSIAGQFDAMVEAGEINVLRDILAVCKIADGRFLLGIDEYKEKISGKLASLTGLTGQSPEFPEGSSDEDIARAFIERMYPEAVKRAYIDAYVSEMSRQKVTELVSDVIEEYHNVFRSADWLSQDAINKTIEKLDAMDYTVFYDEDYVSTTPFTVETGEDAYETFDDYNYYVVSNLASGIFSNDEIGEEKMDTVNAFYVPNKNSFMLCHGYCSSFIDSEDLSKETLYGLLGVTIGHEISHGFDITGSLYDKDGKKQEWWSPEDREAFNGKVAKLASFYNTKLRCFNDVPNNGENIAGEVIADMGGMKVITNLAEKEESFDYPEFYTSFATCFGSVFTKDIAKNIVAHDPHPLSHLRGNVTVAQFERFRKTFDIKPGDGMYIAPEDVVTVW